MTKFGISDLPFTLDMTFETEVIEDQSLRERLLKYGKYLFSSKNNNVRKSDRLFGLKQIFGRRGFLNFLFNLIIFNLTAINLTTIKFASIQLLFVMSNSAINTNPDYAFLRSYCKLSTL